MMRQLSGFSVLIGLLWLWGSSAWGQEAKWTHYGLRPLAMGNAYVAVADDFNALFYNPAGLARLKEWDGEFFNPSLEVSAKTQSFIADAQELVGGESSESTADFLTLVEDQAGNNHHLALGWTPHLIFRNFGFGVGAELLSGTLVFHRYPSVNIDFGPRVVLPIMFAMNFFEERLSVGFGVKYRLRGGINHEFSIQDIEAFKSDSDDGTSTGPKLEDFVEGGSGIGADMGILFTPVKTMEPTIGISMTDIGGTSYEKLDVGGEAVAAPKMVLPSLNMGFSMKPLQSGRMYLLTSVDMHSVNQPISFSKKFNLGSELGWGDLFKLQMGLHQGYMTGGFQFDVGLLNFRLITYSEELGAVAGTIEDRRYALQMKLLL